MTRIDLTNENDIRCRDVSCYDTNERLVAFIGSWVDVTKHEGENSWAHAGIYCGEQFGRKLKKHERRLVYLGMLTAFVNGDRCAHWTDEQRRHALQVAWELIERKRKG